MPLGLAVRPTGVAARLSALQSEHQRLLKEIARKTRELAKWQREIDEAVQTTVEMYPLRDEAARIDRLLHGLFVELLGRKRRPRGERQLLAALFDVLQEIGLISPLGWADSIDGDGPQASVDDNVGDTGPERSPFGSPGYEGGATQERGRPAQVASAAPAQGSLRDVFRRLAMALHPDRVQDEDEKVRRTELMKEISRAYQDHDLARLLSLERAFQERGDVAPATGDTSFLHLTQLNAALRAQLKALARELLDVRRSPEAELVKELRRWARSGGPHPVATAIEDAREELASLQELTDLVTAYRDGKITIGELVRGRPSRHDRTSPQHERTNARTADPEERAFEDLLDDLSGASSGRSGRRAKPRNGRAATKPARDVPL